MFLIEKDKDIRGIELALTRRAFKVTDFTISDATERRNWREKIEEASDGRNTVLYNAENMPGVYVRMPSRWQSQLNPQFPDQVHPAFIVNGSIFDEILIGKHLGYRVDKSGTKYALSLRGVDPTTNINFDDSLACNANNGAGFHCITNAEWAFISLLSIAQGFEARGNTNDGSSHERSDETGRIGSEDSAPRHTMTGSGPRTWSHDGSPYGIFDMVGNIREWVGGLRLDGGEIQVIANNDAADNSTDQSTTGPWKAILQDGSLVVPGTADTLKYDAAGTADNSDAVLNTVINNQQANGDNTSNRFNNTQLASGVTVPDLAKLLQIYPTSGAFSNGQLYTRNYNERLCSRGGGWGGGSAAGLLYSYLSHGRGSSNSSIGFRPAYVNL